MAMARPHHEAQPSPSGPSAPPTAVATTAQGWKLGCSRLRDGLQRGAEWPAAEATATPNDARSSLVKFRSVVLHDVTTKSVVAEGRHCSRAVRFA